MPPPERAQPTPPVVIFVVDNIRNATALYEHLAGKINHDGTLCQGAHPELSNVDEHGRWHSSPRTLVVHSKVAKDDAIPDPLKALLVQAAGLDSKKDAEAAVREMLNTVGKPGQPGAEVRCVVSVAMLTEGWDARTVTHIVGFRAFSTQLLCEQVTGRALRRTSYDALRQPDADGRQRLEPEYADVVGIPFEFMPGAGQPNTAPQPPKPRTRVYTVEGRRHLRVSWPQVTEYVRTAPQGQFALELNRVERWTPKPQKTATTTALSGSVGEEAIISSRADSERQRTAQMLLAAEIARHLTTGEPNRDSGEQGEVRQQGRNSLFRSALAAVGQWAAHPDVAGNTTGEPYDLRSIVADPANRLDAAEAILGACDFGTKQESPRRARLAQPPVADTARVDFETTLAHIYEAARSELSHAACHSRLELLCAQALDDHRRVAAWVRNFQLGWTIPYWDETVWRRYEPDFVARLDGGINLIVECKGAWDDKATAAQHWTEHHWIPCVASTDALADELQRWHYGVIDDPHSVRHQLNLAITAALAKGAM